MLTRTALNQLVSNFLKDLHSAGYNPTKAVLFGSYAYGRPHSHSDVDLALWDDRFTGCGAVDIEPIVKIVSKYPGLELHFFNTGDTDNPFATEIEKKGILLPTSSVLP